MKHKRWIALLLAAVLTIGAMSATAFAASTSGTEPDNSAADSAAKSCRGRHSHKEKTAAPENAVGKDTAKEIALADAGVSPEDAGKVKARVTKLEDGTVVYRVSFTAGELWYCCKIDAVSGEILDTTTEDADGHEAEKAKRENRDGETTEAKEKEAAPAGRSHRRDGKHGKKPISEETGSLDEGVNA